MQEVAFKIPVERFEETLTPLLEKLDNIPSVNSGGCGIVAYGIHGYILENFPDLKPEIVFLFCDDEEDYENRIKIANYEPASAGHVVVKVGDHYIDSEGFKTWDQINEEWDLLDHKPINQALVKKCINEARWNDSFNRQAHVPRIGRVLNLRQYMFDQISTIGV